MKVNAKSFPHPVLGNEDDLGGFFNIEFRYELSKEGAVLNPSFFLRNEAIEDLIKKGKASLLVEVECGATFFRRSFVMPEPVGLIPIPSGLLRGQVTVGFFVCADQDIKDYRPSEPHPDYKGAKFDIEAGDVLAVGGYCWFIAEKSFDPLRPPVSSFMSITEGTIHDGPAEIDYESDKILIILSKTDWSNYLRIRRQKTAESIIHASIVFPVLVDAIYQMDNGDFADKNWFARLDAIIEAKGLKDKGPFEIAQKILDNPVARSFAGANSLFEIPEGEEYE